MSSDSVDRKIAVILATDVVGYSKHMETNEKETVQNLKACEQILTKTFKNHKGRLFNTGGDSFLVEFPSAVEAVECAVSFQEQIKKRNTSGNPTIPLEFRIGINTGDVIEDKDNLLGDGVNIAARLESLAQTNGITISKAVYDFIKGKTDFRYNDLGIQKVKKNEFHAYDILLDPSQKRKLKTQKSNKTILALVASFIIIGIISYFYTSQFTNKNDVVNKTSKPIILVSPIKTTGLSKNQVGFANGVTESMISTLNGYNAITVLSSDTSYHAQKENMNDQSLADNYGVNYIIRGSMQVMGQNARLNLEITDIESSEIVISKKEDFNLDNIFAVQDKMSNTILDELQIGLGVGEKQGSNWSSNFNSLDEFSKFLNWRNELRKFSEQGHYNAEKILNEISRKYENVNDRIGMIYLMEAWQFWQKISLKLSQNIEDDKMKVKLALEKSLKLLPNSPDPYNARAMIGLTLLDLDCKSAVKDIDTAEKISSTIDTLTIGAMVYFRCDKLDKAISARKKAIMIVPNDTNWVITGGLVTILYQVNRIEEIYNIVGDKINSVDIDSRILAIYAVLAKRNGKNDLAKSYLDRSIKNGLTKTYLESQIIDENIRKETIKELLEINYFD